MAAPAGARLRRTWPQRLLITFNLGLVVLCLVGAGGLGYFYYQFGHLPRVDIADGILANEEPPGEPENFLLVGSDSRAFVEPGTEDENSFGDTSDTGDAARADVIILVRVDPRTKKAAMLSFPRDLIVTVAGRDSRNRINTAFQDGPDQLIETISSNFNIPIHHYAQVDFKGFKGLVDAVDGVEIYLPGPVRDRDASGNNVTGLNIQATGCVELTGDQALAYVRSRHFEYQENGRWRVDGTGDIGRIKRQQDFIRRALREALAKGLTNPGRLDSLLDVAIDNVQISKSLDAKDILDLGRNFRSLAPDTLQQFTLPVEGFRTSAGASMLRIPESSQAEAERIFDVFRGIDPASVVVEPPGISVRVLNGSGRPEEAGDTRSALQQAQFATADTGDAQVDIERTLIRYGAGQEAKARLLERYLVSGATLEEFSGLEGIDVVLITGDDFDGVLATPRPADASTTTVPPATPTPTEDLAAPEC